MIARLRRKLTLLVIAVLLLVTAGIIFAISFSTFQNVDRQAYNALRAMSRGQRFMPRSLDPGSTFNMLRYKRPREGCLCLSVNTRSHQPSAEPVVFCIEANDVHLDAADFTVRKVYKINEAENPAQIPLRLAFPVDFHPYDLHRASQIALHTAASFSRTF